MCFLLVCSVFSSLHFSQVKQQTFQYTFTYIYFYAKHYRFLRKNIPYGVCVFVSIIGYIYNVCISRILSTVRPLRERNKISKCKHDKMNCVFRFLVVELAEINLF